VTGNGQEATKLTKWNPKEWHPVYEQILALSCMGKTNVELAEEFNYTPVHISNILTSPMAKLLRRQILNKLRSSVESTLPQKLQDAAAKAMERVQDFMDDDQLYEKSPFAFVDRAMTVLRAAGHSKHESSGGNAFINTRNANVIMTGEAAEIISAALNKSDEARRLHAGEFEIVQEEPVGAEASD
jgi:hypothetical protein